MSRQSGLIDFYKFLKVPNDSSDEDIRKAYKKLALKYHPDKNNGKESDEFKLLIEAYETLKDPSRRAEYDQKLMSSIPSPVRQTSTRTSHTNVRPQQYHHRSKWQMPFAHSTMNSFPSRLFNEFMAGAGGFDDFFDDPLYGFSFKRQTRRRPFAEYDRGAFNRAKKDYENFESYGPSEFGARPNMDQRSNAGTQANGPSQRQYPYDQSSETPNTTNGWKRPSSAYEFVPEDPSRPSVRPLSFNGRKQEIPRARPTPAFSDNYQTSDKQPFSDQTETQSKRHFSSKSNYRQAWGDAFQSYQDASSPEDPSDDDIDANYNPSNGAKQKSTAFSPPIIDLTSETEETANDAGDPASNTNNQERVIEVSDDEETSPQAYENMKSSFMNIPPFTQTNGNFNMSSIGQELGGTKRSAPSAEEDEIPSSPSKKLKPSTIFTPVNESISRIDAQTAEILRQEENKRRALNSLDFHDSDAILRINAPKPPEFDYRIDAQLAKAKFMTEMHDYMVKWNEYAFLVTTYRQERQQADQTCAINSLESIESTKRYLNAVKKDMVVNSQWGTACHAHHQALEETIRVNNM